MSLGLTIAGTYAARGNQSRPAPPAAWLNELAQWASLNLDQQLDAEPHLHTDSGEPILFLQLHPLAEPVEVTAPDRGAVVVSARTSTVGPGYHQFLCSVLDQMAADLRISWTPAGNGESHDETGYFSSRDREQLELAMLEWLGAVCRWISGPDGIATQEPRDPDSRPPAMGMGLDVSYLHDRDLSTPMGPRDLSWVRAAAADPRRGIDFFAWWEEGEGAQVLLNRAAALMWQRIGWVEAVNEDEHDAQREAAELLAEAYALDPSLDYPWREWAQLMELVEWEGEPRAEVELRAEQDDPARPLIGYRRGDALVRIAGGWSIRLPGSLSEFDDDAGDFVASDGPRTVRCFAMSLGDEGDRPSTEEMLEKPPMPPTELEDASDLEPWTRGRLGGCARIGRAEEDGETAWCLEGTVFSDGEVAVLTIYFERDDDRDWAIQTWQSLRFEGRHGDEVVVENEE